MEGSQHGNEALSLSVKSEISGGGGGPYWIRTSDFFGVNEPINRSRMRAYPVFNKPILA